MIPLIKANMRTAPRMNDVMLDVSPPRISKGLLVVEKDGPLIGIGTRYLGWE